MLTWAIAWLIRHDKLTSGLPLICAMIADVTIASYIASAFHH